jgi:hypothetical protein
MNDEKEMSADEHSPISASYLEHPVLDTALRPLELKEELKLHNSRSSQRKEGHPNLPSVRAPLIRMTHYDNYLTATSRSEPLTTCTYTASMPL